MYKLIIVHLLVSSALLVDSLFAGESCSAEGQTGICTLLPECQPILAEIKSAGSPMPVPTRLRLQALTCGFDFNQPLVCCPPSENLDPTLYTATSGSRDVDVSQVPARGKPVQSDNSDVGESNGSFDSSTDNSKLPNTSQNQQNDLNSNEEDDTSDRVLNDGIPDVRKHRNLRLLPTGCGVIESDRILGGNRTRLFELPWMILLSYNTGRGTKLSCGGTLISERYVLTAAHCVSFLGDRLKLESVILGEHDLRQDPDCERVEGVEFCAPNTMSVTIETTIPHPGYRPQTLFDDIALIRLSKPANFSLDSMKPICLPTTPHLQRETLVGKNGVVAGWGITEEGVQSNVLLSVDLPIISNSDCQTAYHGSPRIYDRQLCAGGLKDKDSCGGDSGGPIMYAGRTGTYGVRNVQRGIVSYGSKRCGIGGFPGVYTNVAYYMDWILDNMAD